MDLSERDICSKFISSAIEGAGWGRMSQIREEVSFTAGRIIVRGKLVTRGRAKRADYILYVKPNLPIAVIEAKDNNHAVGDGMQQARTNEDPDPIDKHDRYLMRITGDDAEGCAQIGNFIDPQTRFPVIATITGATLARSLDSVDFTTRSSEPSDLAPVPDDMQTSFNYVHFSGSSAGRRGFLSVVATDALSPGAIGG